MTAVRLQMVVATGNPHKLTELRQLLADLPVDLIGPSELPAELQFEGADETGDTFEANADLKAIHAARSSGLHALADDSGLEVDALGGRPGVRSARYAGEQATDAEADRANNAKLVAEARDHGLERPVARFRCVISVAAPDGSIVARGSGACEGVLLEEARGEGGFGYDPHFYVESLGATFAEITPEQKHTVSHRARALADLRTRLDAVLKDELR